MHAIESSVSDSKAKRFQYVTLKADGSQLGKSDLRIVLVAYCVCLGSLYLAFNFRVRSMMPAYLQCHPIA